MAMNEFTRLIEIIEEFKQVRDQTNLEITSDALFSNARALFISERIEQQRFRERPKQSYLIPQVESLATEPQIKLLKKLRIDVPFGLTKKEAIKLISRKMEDNYAN
jgi:hypothetical protein